MLQCFGLELYSEMGALLESQRFNGPVLSVYVIFFYAPPCVPLPAEQLAGSCSAAAAADPLAWHQFDMLQSPYR
jgi:hypothetical protein